MSEALLVLLGSAAGIGFLHTLIGVDHTLPFILMGRTERWSFRKTMGLVALCGAGHVLASVALGVVGIAIGGVVGGLAWIQAVRGELAAWLLIAFGLTYAAWSLARPRRHLHTPRRSLTPFALVVIFVLGPCEPLIPLLMVPAFEIGALAAAAVALAFALTTVGTMLAVVALGFRGLPAGRRVGVHRHADTLAGLAVAASGLAIRVLGI